MKVLVVHAHENPDSFCSALAEKAKFFFNSKGDEVTISDLYLKGFNPTGGKHDFEVLSDAPYYKYAVEQLKAQEADAFAADLKAEMKLLVEADVLIFNFPLWWFGMPAILKGWVDRVLAYGFAYGGEYGMGPNGRFNGKKAFLCVTTGSPAEFYSKDGVHGRTVDEILKNIKQGILALVGYEVLPSYAAFGVSRITQEAREQILADYETYLEEAFP